MRVSFEFPSVDRAADMLESCLPFAMLMTYRVVEVQVCCDADTEDVRETARKLGGVEVP